MLGCLKRGANAPWLGMRSWTRASWGCEEKLQSSIGVSISICVPSNPTQLSPCQNCSLESRSDAFSAGPCSGWWGYDEQVELTRSKSTTGNTAGAFQGSHFPGLLLWEAGLTGRLLLNSTTDTLSVTISFLCPFPVLEPIPAAA